VSLVSFRSSRSRLPSMGYSYNDSEEDES
jgi:hypothetical protein